MKTLATKIGQSKFTKVVVPAIIVLIVGIYFNFFSPSAVGKNQTLLENSVEVTNSNKLEEQEKTISLEQKTTTQKVDSKPSEKPSLVSLVKLPLDTLVNKSVTVAQIKTIPNENTEPQSFMAKTTQPTSRGGTSPQKQINVKIPVEEPSAAPEEKLVTAQKEPEPPTTKLENSQPSNEKETVNSQLFNQDLNNYVLDIIKTYEIGKHPYLLNTDYTNYNGVTTNITYQGTLIAKANPSGDRASHCVGITFEVFFKAMEERNKKLGIDPDSFNGMTGSDLRNFMLNWFVSDGIKPQQNCSVAVEKYGLGKRIYNFEDAKPGDFIDISRENNTGHTAVFLNWIKKDEKIVGLKYWGSQSSTNGIAYKEEYFNVNDSNGNKLGRVMIDQVYIARVNAVEDYKSFR